MNGSGKGAEAGLGQRQENRRLRTTANDAEHGAEKIVEVAERISLRRFFRVATDGSIRGMPVLVRKRGLLREQYSENEDDAPQAGKHRALIVAT